MTASIIDNDDAIDDQKAITIRRAGADASDAMLARLTAAHPERVVMAQVVVRVADSQGVLRFAAILESFGSKRKIKEFATGVERWIEAIEIMEAA